jgi:glycosyltransferase involved in cell wall biosynthesis
MANIMLLTWLFPPSQGGVESYTYNLAKAISKKHKVIVFTTGKKYLGQSKEPFKIIRIKEMYPYNTTKKSCRELKRELKKAIIKFKIDLVHSHALLALPTEFSSAIIRTVRSLKIPLIDQSHDARTKNLNKNIIKEDIQEIIAVSKFVKKSILKAGGDNKKIKIILSGADSKRFCPGKYSKTYSRKYFNLPINGKMIVFPSRAIRTTTGKFGEQKNFLTLLNSIKDIKKDYGDNFFVVFPLKLGIKENKRDRKKTIKALKQRLKKENIEKNVLWINRRIKFKEMPILYSAADIMCTPSFEEAFGLVFVEAMLMKLPVIGAKSGAVTEIVNKSSGDLINPQNSKELSKIIVNLLKNEKLMKNKGISGRKRALNKFSFNEMVDKIEKRYITLIKNNKPIETNKNSKELKITRV